MEEKKFYGTHEVARMLGVSPFTVWRWCKLGKIKARRTLGGHYRITAEEVKRILREMKGDLVSEGVDGPKSF